MLDQWLNAPRVFGEPSPRSMCRVIVLFLTLVAGATSAHALQAGAAKVAIEAPLGAPMWGHFHQPGRVVVAQHDPLWARALYLEDDAERILIVTIDIFAVTPSLRERVLDFAPEGVPTERIVLVATHTHNGPGGMAAPVAARWVAGPFREDIVQQVAQACGEAMQRAYDSRRRATIDYGVASQATLAINRLAENGPVSEQLGVLRVDDSDGAAIAVAVNFAAHPTTVGAQDAMTYSADYAGYFYDHLESLSSPGCVAMLLPGPLGDQACANPEAQSGWAWTESIGRLLAVRVKGVANELRGHELPLGFVEGDVELPPATADFLPHAAPLQMFSAGNLSMLFVPAEPYATVGGDIATAMRRGSARTVFIVALANGYHGILPSSDLLSAADPEALAQFYGPIAGGAFAAAAARLAGADVEDSAPGDAEERSVGGGAVLLLSGDAELRGRRRGARYGGKLQDVFQQSVAPMLRDEQAAPDHAPWSLAPRYMNLTPFLLPYRAAQARAWFGNFSPSLVDEVAGVASAAGLPFDAVWLSMCAQTRTDTMAPKTFPVRTPEGKMLLGVVAPSPDPVLPPFVHVQPDTGPTYFQIGAGWNAGVAAGLNDSGLVVWCEPDAATDAAPDFEAPMACLARDLLLAAGSVESALAVVAPVTEMRGRLGIADAAAIQWLSSDRLPQPSAEADNPFAALAVMADRTALEAHLRQQASGAPFALGDASTAVCAAILDPQDRVAYIAFAKTGEALGAFEAYNVGTRP
ncbi:MAG: neutral/alkaline non-lysosomal ceramidase N-terminal domain-containing protein [Candidatus Hydrogenedentales bacterium]